MNLRIKLGMFGVLALGAVRAWPASANVYLTGVPDYGWYFGCMGTAAGNLMGYWDRHGLPDFYTGEVNGGVAPLDNSASDYGVTSMWASQAGVDGRPADQPGHVDDYWVAYEYIGLNPYLLNGQTEHAPDCIGDFIGLNQMKWTNQNNECSGNINGFCFNYWDVNGGPRTNFVPSADAGLPARDVQSGLRAWTQSRGYDCTVISQVTDFNVNTPAGKGFGYTNLMAEIDAGYPVLLFLQDPRSLSRTVGGVTNLNPEIHSMLAYGYYVNGGVNYARYRTSWASGDKSLHSWISGAWEAQLPVRGVILYHPLPKIRQAQYSADGSLSLQWDGPASDVYDAINATTRRAQGYVVEMSSSLSPPAFSAVSPVLTTNMYSVANCPIPAFFRIKLVAP